jgi:hypothetical protein
MSMSWTGTPTMLNIAFGNLDLVCQFEDLLDIAMQASRKGQALWKVEYDSSDLRGTETSCQLIYPYNYKHADKNGETLLKLSISLGACPNLRLPSPRLCSIGISLLPLSLLFSS